MKHHLDFKFEMKKDKKNKKEMLMKKKSWVTKKLRYKQTAAEHHGRHDVMVGRQRETHCACACMCVCEKEREMGGLRLSILSKSSLFYIHILKE